MHIEWRRKAGRTVGVVLAFAFAVVLLPIATCEHWLGLARDLAPGDVAPVTVRHPTGFGEMSSSLGLGRVVVGRGQVADRLQALEANALHARHRVGGATDIGLLVLFGLVAGYLVTHLRTTQRGRLLRVQAATLVAFAAVAVGMKIVLLATQLSFFLAPVGAVALLVGTLVDRDAGIGAAVAIALVTSALLVPFDPAVAIVLAAQGVTAVLALHARPKRKALFLLAGVIGGAGAVAAYAAISFVWGSRVPFEELLDPTRSGLVASFLGGVAAGGLAAVGRSLFERAIGDVPQAKLVELADLESPLLKKIAAEAPGTWQHSLAMANLAEICANAIGANALLTRVGAYYHDLGKSLQPQYYIENIGAGQPSPHDQLPPETSADAIFAHVTEGVKLARQRSLPEPVVDFMHMHHGDGVLEYFWSKCQEQGNPNSLTIDAFRYPGKRPQSRETAILAICDALEAASRTLRQPDARQIEQLVQRIIYGKLHLGQLDESGLTVGELKLMANTLVETLKHAHHVRIEYPWQREERNLAAGLAPTEQMSPAALAAASPALAQGSGTRRRPDTFALDSADAPRSTSPAAPAQAAAAATSAPGSAPAPAQATTAPEAPAASAPDPAFVTRPLRSPAELVTSTQELAPAPLGAADLVPPPPEVVIELMRDEESGGVLAPGTLVLGPPPATKPPDESQDDDGAPADVSGTGPIITQAIPAQSMVPPRRRPPPPPGSRPTMGAFKDDGNGEPDK